LAGDIKAGVEAIPIPSVVFIPGCPEDGGLMALGYTHQQCQPTTQFIDLIDGGSH